MMKPLTGLCVVALALLSGVASAQPTEDVSASAVPDLEQARTHFQRGAVLYKEGNFDAALAEFNRALEVVPNYRVLYNIGQVQVERHDYVAAWHAFEDYLRQGGADVSAERREQVERDILNLKTRISELKVTSNVEGAALSVDGVPVGTVPLEAPLLVSAGSRRLTASKPGYATVERMVNVAGGDTPVIALHLETLQTLPNQTTNMSERGLAQREGSPGAGAWVSLAATGVFATGAVVFGLLAREQNDQLDDELSRFPADRGATEDKRSDVKVYAGLTDGCLAAAGVSAAFATYFFLSSGSGRSEAKPAPRKAARLVPLAPGLAVLGEF